MNSALAAQAIEVQDIRPMFGTEALAPKAFTLVELLVVMAIIVILASLTMLGLARAGKLCARTSCESQLRQLTVAWVAYADDNNGRLVPNKTEGDPTQSTADSWVVGSVKTNTGVPGINAGALFPFVRSAAVYRCPADNSAGRSTSMNPGLNWFDDTALREPLPDSYMVRTIMQIYKPTETFVFIDEDRTSVDDGFFGIAWPPGKVWTNLPGTRHDPRKTPMSYADGHVTEIKWRALKTWVGYDQPATGPDDLADLFLIQSKVIPR
jgi:prepilin-type N-terminal cleavage/methylation domain-containing protein/prepilin-type processing-associated H-X9-DG protein